MSAHKVVQGHGIEEFERALHEHETHTHHYHIHYESFRVVHTPDGKHDFYVLIEEAHQG